MPRMEASIGSVSCRPLPVTIDTQSSIAREVWPPRRQGRFMCATAPAVVPFESTRRTHGILSGKGQASTTSSMERQRTGSWAGAMIGSSSQASSGSIRLKVNRVRVTIAGRTNVFYGEPVMADDKWTPLITPWPTGRGPALHSFARTGRTALRPRLRSHRIRSPGRAGKGRRYFSSRLQLQQVPGVVLAEVRTRDSVRPRSRRDPVARARHE